MKCKCDFLSSYVAQAPLALAFERALECELYPGLAFPGPVLDLGCGEGLFASLLFEEPIDTGIDPNPRELARARELGAYRELVECFGDAIPKPDAAYGTVISNSVFEHIPDLAPVFREVLRTLKPGGNFYLTVPSENFERYTAINFVLEALGLSGLSRRYRAAFNKFWAHHHTYPLEQWKALCIEAGFQVEEAFTYNSRRSCLLNDTLVPVSLPSLLVKKLTNRWVLFSSWRQCFLAPLARHLRRDPAGDIGLADGGLVFLHLRKPAPPIS